MYELSWRDWAIFSLNHIDKRLWRLEAMMMASTLTIVAAAGAVFLLSLILKKAAGG